MKKKNFIYLILFLLFIGLNIVEAKTSASLDFCKYAGTRRAVMIVGYIIMILKILVPIILIGVCIKELVMVIISGDSSQFSKSVSTMLKRVIAGIIVFMIPTIIDSVFTLLVGGANPDLNACSVCLFRPNNCKVYDGDDKDKEAQCISDSCK